MVFSRIGELLVHHEKRGGAKGSTLALANSLGTDFRIWDPLLAELSDDHRIVRYDKRGHGLTSLGSAPCSMDDLAQDLASLLDRLEVGPAVIVGLSIGGMIAQALADRRPDLVRGLVLMDTAHKIGTVEMWDQRIAAVKAGGIEAIADGVLERWFSREFRANRRDELEGWRNMLVRTPAAGYIACSRAIRDTDLSERARALKVPALCMVGDEDGSTPVEVVRGLQALIAESELEIVEGAGHLPCIEHPARMARRIERFIDERVR